MDPASLSQAISGAGTAMKEPGTLIWRVDHSDPSSSWLALPALRRWQRLGATLASAAARVARAPLGHRMHRGLASLQRRGARDAAQRPMPSFPCTGRVGRSFLCTGRVRPGGFTLALPTPPRPHSLPCPWVVLSALSLILPLPLGVEPAPRPLVGERERERERERDLSLSLIFILGWHPTVSTR